MDDASLFFIIEPCLKKPGRGAVATIPALALRQGREQELEVGDRREKML